MIRDEAVNKGGIPQSNSDMGSAMTLMFKAFHERMEVYVRQFMAKKVARDS